MQSCFLSCFEIDSSPTVCRSAACSATNMKRTETFYSFLEKWECCSADSGSPKNTHLRKHVREVHLLVCVCRCTCTISILDILCRTATFARYFCLRTRAFSYCRYTTLSTNLQENFQKHFNTPKLNDVGYTLYVQSPLDRMHTPRPRECL